MNQIDAVSQMLTSFGTFIAYVAGLFLVLHVAEKNGRSSALWFFGSILLGLIYLTPLRGCSIIVV